MDMFNVCVEVGAVRGNGGRLSRGRPTAYLPTRKLAPQRYRAPLPRPLMLLLFKMTLTLCDSNEFSIHYDIREIRVTLE